MNQKTFRAVFASIAGLVVLAILSPVIWLAAKAGVGLIILSVLAIVGFGLIQFIPHIGQKIENTVLNLRKQEARQNPIEQLQNFLIEKSNRVSEFKNAVTQISSQIKSLEAMVIDRKKQRPNYDSTAQENSIRLMKEAHQTLVEKYKNAERALENLKVAIQDKEFEWKFSQAGQVAMKSLNATSGKELIESMLADEAFSSVTDNFNTVFADLEMEALKLTNANQLEFSPGMSIDVSTINLIPTNVR